MSEKLKNGLIKQENGCGLYAIANACNLPEFITPERLEISKNGNTFGQLSKWLQDDGHPFCIDVLYYNHEGKNIPSKFFGYHTIHEDNNPMPVLFNVQSCEKCKRHLIGGWLHHDGKLTVFDSLKNEPFETRLYKLNQMYEYVFGFLFLMSVETGDYIFIG